jgi:hypothetical protein
MQCARAFFVRDHNAQVLPKDLGKGKRDYVTVNNIVDDGMTMTAIMMDCIGVFSCYIRKEEPPNK